MAIKCSSSSFSLPPRHLRNFFIPRQLATTEMWCQYPHKPTRSIVRKYLHSPLVEFFSAWCLWKFSFPWRYVYLTIELYVWMSFRSIKWMSDCWKNEWKILPYTIYSYKFKLSENWMKFDLMLWYFYDDSKFVEDLIFCFNFTHSQIWED